MKADSEIASIALAFGCSADEARTAEYLGDSVYATHDGCQIWLRTFNGISVSNSIALEPEVVAELESYVEAFRNRPQTRITRTATCGECGGSGKRRIDGNDNITCPDCGGKGEWEEQVNG